MAPHVASTSSQAPHHAGAMWALEMGPVAGQHPASLRPNTAAASLGVMNLGATSTPALATSRTSQYRATGTELQTFTTATKTVVALTTTQRAGCTSSDPSPASLHKSKKPGASALARTTKPGSIVPRLKHRGIRLHYQIIVSRQQLKLEHRFFLRLMENSAQSIWNPTTLTASIKRQAWKFMLAEALSVTLRGAT
jgi:hypothetical protein